MSLDSWVHLQTVSDERSLRHLKLINSGLELQYKKLCGRIEGEPEITGRLLMSAAKGVLGILKETAPTASVIAYGLDFLSNLLRTEGERPLGIVNFEKNLQDLLDSRWLLFFDQDEDSPAECGSAELCVVLSTWQAQLALFDRSTRLKPNRLMQLSRLLEWPDTGAIAPEFAPFQEMLKDSLCLLADSSLRALGALVSPLRAEAQETVALRRFLGNRDEIDRRRADLKSRVLREIPTVFEIPESLRHAVQPFRIEALNSWDDRDIRALASSGGRAKELRKAVPGLPYLKVAVALCAEIVWRGMADLVAAQKNELSSIPGRDGWSTDAASLSERLSMLLEQPHMLPLLATTTEGLRPHIAVFIPAPAE
jgi:hypothetical protein